MNTTHKANRTKKAHSAFFKMCHKTEKGNQFGAMSVTKIDAKMVAWRFHCLGGPRFIHSLTFLSEPSPINALLVRPSLSQ